MSAPEFDAFAKRGGPHHGRNHKIMRRRNRGAAFRALRPLIKLGEEAGELSKACSDVILWHADDYSWGLTAGAGSKMRASLIEEMGDVLACLILAAQRFALPWADIEARARFKLTRFKAWGF